MERSQDENDDNTPNNNLEDNKLLTGNNVGVDILPKVHRNSVIVNLCSCFNVICSYTDK